MARKKNISVFQAHLPFKSRIPKRPVAVAFVLEKRAFAVLGAVLLMLIVLYSYFIMLSVSHVVVREEVMYKTEQLSSEVTALEQAYLAHSLTITEHAAHTHGFERARKQTFVERGAVTLTNAR